MIDNLRRIQRRVKVLKASDAGPVHPFKVELDALLRDIAVHPMPPNARMRALWWIFESALERVRIALRRRLSEGKDQHNSYRRESDCREFHCFSFAGVSPGQAPHVF